MGFLKKKFLFLENNLRISLFSFQKIRIFINFKTQKDQIFKFDSIINRYCNAPSREGVRYLQL